MSLPDQGLLTTVQPKVGWHWAASETDAPRHRRRSRRGDLWGLLVVFVVATVLGVVYSRGGLAHPTTAWSSAPGDPETAMWFLSWVRFAVFHGQLGLVTNYGVYPAGANLMWNTSIYLPALVLSPLTWLAGPVFSYNVLVVAGPVVAACTSYLLFLRYLETSLGALVGALAFGFSPFLIFQHGHQQLTLLGLLPLTLIVLDEILVRQRWRWWAAGLVLGALAAAQLLTGEELLVIAGLLGAVIVVVAALLHPRQVVRKAGYALRALPAAGIAFGALAAYPLYVQFAGPQREVEVHASAVFSTDLTNFIQPIFEVFDPKLVSHWAAYASDEATGYLGVPLLVAIVVAVALTLRRRPIIPVALAVLLVFGVLTLGPELKINGHAEGPWVWQVLDRFGPLQQLLPGRLTVVVDLFAAFLLGVFVDAVVVRGPRVGRALGAALVVLVLLSWVPVSPRVSRVQVPSFFTTSAKRVIPQGSVALVLPYVAGPYSEAAQVWQAASGMRFRTVDNWLIVPGRGRSTVLTRAMRKLSKQPVAVTPKFAANFKADMAAEGVQEVIVGPGPLPATQANTEAFFTDFFGRRADVQSGGVVLWWVNTGSAQRRSTT